jgi:hypothetical protein
MTLSKYSKLTAANIEGWNSEEHMLFLMDVRFVIEMISRNNQRSEKTQPKIIKIPFLEYTAKFPTDTMIYDSITGNHIHVTNPPVAALKNIPPNQLKLQEVQQNPPRLLEHFLYQGIEKSCVVMHAEQSMKLYAAATLSRTISDMLKKMCSLQGAYDAHRNATVELENARKICICTR